MKIKNLIAGLALSLTMGAGVFASVGLSQNAKEASAVNAGTEIYLDVSGGNWFSDSAKVAIWNHQGSCFEEFTSDASSGLYKTTLSANCTSFNLFRGSALNWDNKWNQSADSGFESGKNLIKSTGYNNGTMTFTWDVYTSSHTITKYAVKNNVKDNNPIGTDTVLDGATYNVPAGIFISGYSFDGWYTNEACTTDYTARAISNDLTIYGKYTSGTWSGTVHIDLRDSTWAGAAANYAIYFWNNSYSTDVNGWSNYLTGTTAGIYLLNLTYSLQFEPTKMSVVRYNPSYSQADWNANKWATGDNAWGQSKDASFNEMAIIRPYDSEAGKNSIDVGYPRVLGGIGTGSWSELAVLDNLKTNEDSHKVEYYSTSVTLAANTNFKIVDADDTYYGKFDTHSSISSIFTGDQTNNINCSTAGTYAFYFKSEDHETYITTVDLAAADDWSQYFLDNVGCDPNGVNLPSGWSTCATEYAKLSSGAKDIVYGASSSGVGLVNKAVARYDLAVSRHPSLTKFIVDGAGTHTRSAASIKTPIALESEQTTSIIIIAVVTLVSVSAIGGYFFFRKRRVN